MGVNKHASKFDKSCALRIYNSFHTQNYRSYLYFMVNMTSYPLKLLTKVLSFRVSTTDKTISNDHLTYTWYVLFNAIAYCQEAALEGTSLSDLAYTRNVLHLLPSRRCCTLGIQGQRGRSGGFPLIWKLWRWVSGRSSCWPYRGHYLMVNNCTTP